MPTVKKFLIFLLLFFQVSSLTSKEYPSPLTDFFKCLLINSESGYVFFGSKPVCYFGISNSHAVFIGTSEHELDAKLRIGIHWWEAAQPTQENDNYVLKIKKQETAYEILSLNKKSFIQAVEDNLALFRYVLGSKVTPELLFTTIATSEEPFYKLLNNNDTLVGILLGFGTENSILGARFETLSTQLVAYPEIPYITLSEKTPEEAFYNSSLAFLFKGNFKLHKEKVQSTFGFSSIKQEKVFIKNLAESRSHLLSTYSPRFIFESYLFQKNNNELLSTLESQQQEIIKIFQTEDFVSQVLKRLNIVFLNPEPHFEVVAPSPIALARELKETLRRRLFNDLEGACEGIQDADLGKPERCPEPDLDLFYDLLVLLQLQKSLRANETYFKALKQNLDFIEVSEQIYIRNLETNSNGHPIDTLQKKHSKAMFSYAAYLPTQNEILPVKAESHVTINLNEVIQGVALGVQGMKTGELREIHLHPDAAYGFLGDFQTSEPLKFLVRLESIEKESPQLIFTPKPVALNRSLILSLEEIDTLNKMTRDISYHSGKSFWDFYKTASTSSSKDLIDQLKIVWNEPEQEIVDESLDYATVKIYEKRHKQEKERAHLVFKNNHAAVPLKKDLLYVQYEKHGKGSASWPKSISLIFKNLDGDVLRKVHFESLTLKELGCLSQGLQIGLKNSIEGDKGTFFIDPDLTDQGLFRNKFAHQALVVEFAVQGVMEQ